MEEVQAVWRDSAVIVIVTRYSRNNFGVSISYYHGIFHFSPMQFLTLL